MRSSPPSDLDIHKIIHHFNRAAKTYDAVSVLQQEVGMRMLQRLELIKLQPKTILDLGCGTGFFTKHLQKRYPKAQIISLDIAYNMLTIVKKKSGWFSQPKLICAAAEHLPLAPLSIDLIFANQALPWCPDLTKTFLEIKRTLTPGGLLMFSTLGPDTLKELRHCWQQFDQFAHVHSFIDMHDIGDMLLHARLADPVMDMEYFTLTYSHAMKLLQELKANGASNASIQQSPALAGKHKLAGCIEKYAEFKDGNNLLPATFEIIYGHAWQPLTSNHADANPNEVTIAVNAIKKIRS